MSKRPSNLRDVAALAGVSPATASMALRELARVPEGTRKKVHVAASALGYVRNPEIGNVLARARSKAPRDRQTLVFLTETDVQASADRRTPWLRQFYLQARDTAHLLGCEIEAVTLPQTAAAQRRLGQTLWARGICGLLVGPVTLLKHARVDMDWAKFAAVELGSTLESPALNRIERAFYEDCLILYEWLRQRGYKRIGLAITEQRRRFMCSVADAALLLHVANHPDACATVPLCDTDFHPKGYRCWLERERPDVAIFYQSDVPAEIPGQARTPTAYLSAVEPQQTGLVPDIALMTKDAVHFLHRLVITGERGTPIRRCSHAYRNIFQAGTTA